MRPIDNYLSPQGYAKFKAEWEQLKYIDKPEMQEQIRVAAAEGDRSENAAYTYGKMQIRKIDQRLRYLDKVIDKAIVVEEVAQDGTIRFGASVEVYDLEKKKTYAYTLVGSSEIDVLKGHISLSSPLGKLLVGKRINDNFQQQTPRGVRSLEILKIEYN
jgi:transcription elongation GreA/GreB family factor